MKKIFLSFLSLISIACYAQPFGAGNIVVVRIGAGAAPMVTGVAQPVFLDEYTPTGTLVRSIAMPTATNGSNRKLTLPVSTDYSEGYISLSPDRQNLAVCGYDELPGADTVATSLSATIRRVVGVINAAGTINTSTALNTFNKVVIRSAVVNGTDVWTTGASGGIMYTTVGGTTQTLVSATTGRCLDIFGGQLYATSSATGVRMTTVGTGLPTTTGQTMTNFSGYPTDGSPYQFFLADLSATEPGVDVLYTADNNLLRKFSKVAGTWVSNGTIGTVLDKYRGLTGRIENGNIILFAARKNDNAAIVGGEIVSLIDNTGYNASFASLTPTVIATAPVNTVFRGVSFAPSTPLITTPVTLTSFSGKYSDKQVQLKWTTASEINNSHFNIQHSTDGVSFNKIGRVEGIKNTTQAVNYTFNDQQPAAGKNYYRLEQVDIDGKSRIYNTILISTQESKTAFKVIATPATSRLEVTLTSTETVQGTVSVIDMNGRALAQKNLSFVQGTSKVFVELPQLSSGLYIAVLTTDKGLKLMDKFIK